MFPSMDPQASNIKSKPHLVLKVLEGWHWDEKKTAFLSADNDVVELQTLLPKQASIVLRIPTASPNSDSKHERELSRYYNLMLNDEKKLQELKTRLEPMSCIESVSVPVDPSLPNPNPNKS